MGGYGRKEPIDHDTVAFPPTWRQTNQGSLAIVAVSEIKTFIRLPVTCHGPGRKELTGLDLP